MSCLVMTWHFVHASVFIYKKLIWSSNFVHKCFYLSLQYLSQQWNSISCKLSYLHIFLFRSCIFGARMTSFCWCLVFCFKNIRKTLALIKFTRTYICRQTDRQTNKAPVTYGKKPAIIRKWCPFVFISRHWLMSKS